MLLILLTYGRCQKATAYVTVMTVTLNFTGNVCEPPTVRYGNRTVAIRDTTEHPALVSRLLVLTPLANSRPLLVCILALSI